MLLFASSPQAQQTLPRFEASDCLIAIPPDVRVDCGNLVVAEQRARPTGPTVRLPVAIFRAPQPSGASPLLMLHGGPGANGLRSQFSRQAAAWALAFRRDIVVYDQRGAGLSQPRLCPEVIEKAIAARTTDIVDTCLASLKAAGIDRSAYTTEANADDAIDLRRTLGHASWDVYGVSYGGRLALELMRRDPSGLRAVILASALPVGPRFQAEDALTYQRALERIFANCAAQPNCATAFPTLERDFYTVHEELTARPIVVPVDSGSTLTLDASAFVSGVQRQLGNADLLTRIPLLIHELRRGDRTRAARALAGRAMVRPNPAGMLVNAYDVCGNALRAAAEAANQQVHPAFRRDQPFANCHLWQTRFADPATHAPVRSDIPTLILTAEYDDRDPTDYGRAIAATLSRSYLHEIPGRVHGPLFGACQDAMIMQFLNNPARPPDASCVGQNARTFETRSLDLQRFVFQIAVVGEPASLAGTWEVALPGPQNVTTIDLRVSGTMLSGTVAQPRGTAAILDGRFEHGTLAFKAISPDGQRTISLSGVVDGDHITFTRGLVVHPGGNPGGEGIFGALGPGAFTAARVN